MSEGPLAGINQYFPISFNIALAVCSLVVSACFILAEGSIVFAQTRPIDEENLIHFGDVIDVDVVGSFEFDWRGKLNPEGYLDGMNTYGEPVYGLCRSESEISAAAALALSKTLREPKIIVRIVDRSKRAVATLDGAVRSPQRFQLRRAARLQELLVLAGGISDDASGEIQIFRPPQLNCFERSESSPAKIENSSRSAESGPPVLTVKISDILKGDPDANLQVRSGDLITVLRAVPVYIIGGVNDPRPIVARPGLTLSRAIAMAGGIAKEGRASGLAIYRRDGGGTQVINADLGKIESKTSDDPLILPFDIIEVPQKNKPIRKFAPVIESARNGRPAALPLRIID